MRRELNQPVTILGHTNYRGQSRKFGIGREDRFSHFYVIGKSGTGKTTLLATMIQQDLAEGEGLAVFDPHGDLVTQLVHHLPSHRKKDLIYLNVPDRLNPTSYNPLQGHTEGHSALTASLLIDAFKKLWPESWGPRVEHLWRNAILALLEQPFATLADVPRLLNEDGFRKQTAAQTANPIVREYWLREYAAYPARFRAEVIAPLQNKVGAFLSIPRLRAILTQSTNDSLNLRQVMDEGKILLINLAKGLIGDDAASLLGALLLSGMEMAALGRAELPPEKRRDFFIFLDEFQSYATLTLANMLAELRKYRVGLTLAHQHLAQLDPQVRDAIIGNAGSLACFRVGTEDAAFLEKEFDPPFQAHDLVNIPNLHMYIKLTVHGVMTRPFSAETTSSFR